MEQNRGRHGNLKSVEKKNHKLDQPSRKHAYIILTPLNPTFI